MHCRAAVFCLGGVTGGTVERAGNGVDSLVTGGAIAGRRMVDRGNSGHREERTGEALSHSGMAGLALLRSRLEDSVTAADNVQGVTVETVDAVEAAYLGTVVSVSDGKRVAVAASPDGGYSAVAGIAVEVACGAQGVVHCPCCLPLAPGVGGMAIHTINPRRDAGMTGRAGNAFGLRCSMVSSASVGSVATLAALA